MQSDIYSVVYRRGVIRVRANLTRGAATAPLARLRARFRLVCAFSPLANPINYALVHC